MDSTYILILLIEQQNFDDITIKYLITVNKCFYNIITDNFKNKLIKSNSIKLNTIHDFIENKLEYLSDKYYYMIYNLIIKFNPNLTSNITFTFDKCEDCHRYNLVEEKPACASYQGNSNMCCYKYVCINHCKFTCNKCNNKIVSRCDDGWHCDAHYADFYENNDAWKFTCDKCNNTINFQWWGNSLPEYFKRNNY